MTLNLQKPKGKAAKFILAPPARLNILHGSVRSGKTLSSILKWIHLVKNEASAECLMVGKTERTLIRNIINPMREMLPESVIHLNEGKGELILYGKRVYLVGANDQRSEAKIRGASLQFAYVDEGTIIPEEFFKMLQTRLSEPNAQLYVTTNPDNPYHWMKTEIIDRAYELNANIWHFTLDDNPYLDPDYVDDLKRSFSGLWYDRYILGLWVLAEGVVYPMFNEAVHVREPEAPERLLRYAVSVDYGTTNPCVFGMYAIDHVTNTAYKLREYYHDSVKTGRQKTDSEYAADMQHFIGGFPVEAIIVDPSATSFITELRRWKPRGMPRVIPADNDVLPGIQAVSNLLNRGKLYIHPRCKNSIREYGAYVWDSKAQARGEDKPLKVNDHCSDETRYFVTTWYGKSHRVDMDAAKGYGGIA